MRTLYSQYNNIPSHPIVVYHPYRWEHYIYSQYNNNNVQVDDNKTAAATVDDDNVPDTITLVTSLETDSSTEVIISVSVCLSLSICL